MEKIIHTKPSGCDVQIVSNGGLMIFQHSKPQINLNIKSQTLFNFILVNTNKQRQGKVTIEKVAAMPEGVRNDAIGQIGDITEMILECLNLESQEPVD